MNRQFDPVPYWHVVEDCLVEIHGMRPDEAKRVLVELHDRLAQLADRGVDTDLTFHEEEFNLACDLAGVHVPFEPYREHYFRIVSRHYPGWDARLAASSKPA
ncbi:MAG: hypothetical protein U0893_05330 [Chloroflexota bacterium]